MTGHDDGPRTPAPTPVTPEAVQGYRALLTRGEDAIDPNTWAGSFPTAYGIAPRIRIGANRWFNLLQPAVADPDRVRAPARRGRGPPPRSVFGEKPSALERANHLRFRLSPDVAIALGVRSKVAGEAMSGQDVELLATRCEAEGMLPYARLLGDAMKGDAILFARQDAIEAQWRVVDGILDGATPVHQCSIR